MAIEYHPDYQARARRYKFYELSDEGGYAYVTGLDENGRTMLVQFTGQYESEDSWTKRLEIAEAPEYCARILNLTHWFVSSADWGITRPTVQKARDNGQAGDLAAIETPQFDAWSFGPEGVDRQGSTFLEFLHAAGRKAQRYGIAYIGMDAIAAPEGENLTQQQVIDAGMRPYLYHIDPQRLVDWSINQETGAFSRVVINSTFESKEDFHSKLKSREQFTEWFDDHWVVYGPKGVKIDEGQHKLGRVPIFSMYYIDPESGQRSQLQGIAGPQRKIFNTESWLDAQLVQCGLTWYAVLVPPESGWTPSAKSYAIAPGDVVHFPASDIKSMGGEPQQVEKLLQRIGELEQQILRNAHLLHEAATIGAQASGERVRAERITYEQVLLNASIQRASTGDEILSHMANIGHIEAGISVERPETFDPSAGTRVLEELIEMSPIRKVPPPVLKLLWERYFNSRFPNASPKDAQDMSDWLQNADNLTEPDAVGTGLPGML